MQLIETLSENLQCARGDWARVQAVFLEHLKSGFLDDFVTREISILAGAPKHVVPLAVSQTTFIFLNTWDFEYSARLLVSFAAREHPVKWQGVRQIINVTRGGPVTIRRITVPQNIRINVFEPGVQGQAVETVDVAQGGMIANEGTNELLDIHAVSSPSIIEILTDRRGDSELNWTFDTELKSIYREQSSVTVSRVSNVLDLAHVLGKPIPDDILSLTLDPSKPHVALLAIRSMLASGHPEAFVQLQRAIDARSETLSQGAQRLFDILTASRSEVRAN